MGGPQDKPTENSPPQPGNAPTERPAPAPAPAPAPPKPEVPKMPEAVAAAEKTAERREERQGETQQEARARLAALGNESSKAKALDDFRNTVVKSGHDFEGDDFNEAELKTNPVFLSCYEKMREIFSKVDQTWPANIQDEYMTAVTNFVSQEIAKYKNSPGKMAKGQADEMMTKVLDAKAGGVGSFEEWMKEKHADLIQKRETEHAAEKDLAEKDLANAKSAFKGKLGETKTALGVGATLAAIQTRLNEIEAAAENAKNKEELGPLEEELKKLSALSGEIAPVYDRAIALETRLKPLPAPSSLASAVEKVKTDIGKSGSENLASFNPELQRLEGEISALETVNALAQDASIPQERRTEILNQVREGKMDFATAKSQLEREKNLAAAALSAAEGENAPPLDKLLRLSDKWTSGGMKDTIQGFAKMLLKIVATFASVPIIGKLIRGLASNKLLAQEGDSQAKLALKMEDDLAKFGLPKTWANEHGDKSGIDAVKYFEEHADELVADEAEKARLAVFVRELKAKGAAGSKTPLVEFMNGEAWKSVQYPAQTAVAASAEKPSEKTKGDAIITKLFTDVTPDEQATLKKAKIAEVAKGTVPTGVNSDRAKKIIAKLNENGAGSITNQEMTVEAFIRSKLENNWEIV